MCVCERAYHGPLLDVCVGEPIMDPGIDGFLCPYLDGGYGVLDPLRTLYGPKDPLRTPYGPPVDHGGHLLLANGLCSLMWRVREPSMMDRLLDVACEGV